ncbi:hypothetical protein GCM10007967_29810 [Xylanimonas ulmi]
MSSTRSRCARGSSSRAWTPARCRCGRGCRRQGLNPPSRATLARAFAAAGVSRPEPRKRPRAANRRFVYPAPNCCWQIDAFTWSLADGTTVAVHQVIDDHSRLATATLVAEGETSKAAVQVVAAAIRRWGVPQRLLSDNGLAFNPTRRGFTGKLVDYLLDLGVKPITGKPDRPTTQGKNERFHQTLQKWLNARPPARTIADLQASVDEFDQYYNHERVHQALDGKTPAEAWAATAPAPEPTPEPRMPQIPPSLRTPTPVTPAPPATGATTAMAADEAAAPPTSRRTRTPLALHAATGNVTLKVKPNGQVKVLSCLFYVATSRAGQPVHAIWDENKVEIFTHDGEHLVSYPRPETTGMYYGPRTARQGTPMKTTSQNPSAGVTGTALRTVTKGGYVGVLGSKFYAGYKRAGQHVTITWDATTVAITDTAGTPIASYDKPTRPRGWHGPTESRMSTKS